MNLFVSRRYDSCFLKWYSESELLPFLFFQPSCLATSASPAGDSFSFVSCSGIFRFVEYLT